MRANVIDIRSRVVEDLPSPRNLNSTAASTDSKSSSTKEIATGGPKDTYTPSLAIPDPSTGAAEYIKDTLTLRFTASSIGAPEASRTARLAAIQQAITDGTYNVPAEAIADRLIDRMLKP